MIVAQPLDPALAEFVDFLAEMVADDLLDGAPPTDAKEHAEEHAA